MAEGLRGDNEGAVKERHGRVSATKLLQRRRKTARREGVVRMDGEDTCERLSRRFQLVQGAGDQTQTVIVFRVVRVRGARPLEGIEFCLQKMVNALPGRRPRSKVVAQGAIAQALGDVGGKMRPGEHAQQQIPEFGQGNERSGDDFALQAGAGQEEPGVDRELPVDAVAGSLEFSRCTNVAAIAKIGIGAADLFFKGVLPIEVEGLLERITRCGEVMHRRVSAENGQE